jgi:hypothetical protein
MYALVCTKRVKREAALGDNSDATMIAQQPASTLSEDKVKQDSEAALDLLASFCTQGFITLTSLLLCITSLIHLLFFDSKFHRWKRIF